MLNRFLRPSPRSRLTRLLPFGLFLGVGVLNTAIHSAVVVGMSGFLGIAPVVAHFCAFCAANVFSYFMNARFVFGRRPSVSSYVRFLAVSLVSLGSTMSIAAVCQLLDVNYLVGLALVIVVSPPLTYALQRIYCFGAEAKIPAVERAG